MSCLMKRTFGRFMLCVISQYKKYQKIGIVSSCGLQYSSDSTSVTQDFKSKISAVNGNTSTFADLKVGESFVTVTSIYEENPLLLHYIWLRDHCRCEKCFNNSTKQRAVTLSDIPVDIKPINCQLEDDILIITWHDGHISKYSIDWLQNNTFNQYDTRSKTVPVLWTKDTILNSDIAHVDIKQLMNSEATLSELITSVLKYGCGFVENVPATLEATESVSRRVTLVQRTFFGDMWEFSASMVHSDSAYTTSFLGAHTDGTYLTEAPGVQVFHCLCHDGSGGETLLVDGFRAANDVKMKYPDSYERLCNIPQGAEYIEKGKHYVNVDSVLKLNPVTKCLQQIRFNMYDRSPVNSVPTDLIPQFYNDLRRLLNSVCYPDGEWWLKLSPGTVLFIDNWRVLHGRASYTGYRKMGGCYQGRADFISKARVLGLL